MGRIIGGVNFRDKACGNVANILAGIKHPFPWTHKEIFSHDFVQVLRFAPPADRTSCFFEDQDGFLLLDGRIFLDEDLVNGEKLANRQNTLTERLMRIYREQGPERLCGLNGMYLIVVWDEILKTLFIANDILGLKPCYYWFYDGQFLFGTQYEPMTRHPNFTKDINSEAVVDLMIMGCVLEDRTLFRHVKCLQPGSLLSCNDRGVNVQEQIQLRCSDAKWGFSGSQLIDEMATHLDRAVQVRLKDAGSTLLPLSGGLDSRTLAGFCRKYCSDITTLTYGLKKHTDVKIARSIAKSLDLPHLFIKQGADFLLKNADIHLSITEGSSELLTASTMPVLNLARDDYQDIIHGYLGDCLHGENFTNMVQWMRQYGTSHADSLFNYYARRFPPQVLASYLSDDLKDHADGPGDSVKKFFNRLDGSTLHKCLLTDFNYRNRHYISCQLNILEDCARVHAPFTDLNYLNFIFSLPPIAFENNYLYQKMISTKLPEVAHLVNTNTGMPLELTAKSIAHRLWLSLETRKDFFLEIPRQLSSRPHRLQRKSNMWDTFSCVEEPYPALYGETVRELYEYLKPFFNLDAVDKLFFSDSKEDPKAHGTKLRRIYGFALWLKRYIK